MNRLLHTLKLTPLFKMISFKLDTRAAQKIMNSLERGLNDFKPVLKQASQYQLGKVEQQFGSEGETITGKWKELQQKTIKQRIAAGYGPGPILTASGKLRKSVKQEKLTPTELRIGSKNAYFKYHQLGTSKMPQRQILGHSREMTDKVVDIAQKYVTNLLRNG